MTDNKNDTMEGVENNKGTNSPYYLNPSDHPGMVICPVQLRGDNYEEWSRAMKNSLRAKRKLGFIEGTIQKPEEAATNFKDWCTVNAGGRGRGYNRANTVHGGDLGTQAGIAEVDRAGFPGLDADQWDKLLNLLGSSKNNCDEKLTSKLTFDDWLLDTGASQHMTGCLELLRDITDITPCLVGLPDGAQTSATKAGTLNLGNNIYLHNVLFVPHLTCTLISVAQMMEQLNCFVTFSPHFCVIQDRASKTMIGAGEQRDGVYVFRQVKTVRAHKAETVDSLERWHQKAGPSVVRCYFWYLF